ncbi:MAG: GSU2403 family nucleotidyltransferase fold protein, partial [Pseudomonadota bacterium]
SVVSAQYCRPTASLRCDSSQTLDIDFALHKLLVYGEREGGFAAKSSKDLHQSASLLAYYREHGTWDIDEAWADLVSRGKGWVRRALQGVKALDRAYPELGAGGWLKAA